MPLCCIDSLVTLSGTCLVLSRKPSNSGLLIMIDLIKQSTSQSRNDFISRRFSLLLIVYN